MKVSVSLPEEDVEFLDTYARSHGHHSRSAALHEAVTVLRSGQLAAAYEEAWASWDAPGEAGSWEAVSADGLER